MAARHRGSEGRGQLRGPRKGARRQSIGERFHQVGLELIELLRRQLVVLLEEEHVAGVVGGDRLGPEGHRDRPGELEQRLDGDRVDGDDPSDLAPEGEGGEGRGDAAGEGRDVGGDGEVLPEVARAEAAVLLVVDRREQLALHLRIGRAVQLGSRVGLDEIHRARGRPQLGIVARQAPGAAQLAGGEERDDPTAVLVLSQEAREEPSRLGRHLDARGRILDSSRHRIAPGTDLLEEER